jgi:uncharacterized Zn-binding protein involved in type VI secretion
MGSLAAKRNDEVKAVDVHLVQAPAPGPPAPLPHDFAGKLDGNLVDSVRIRGEPAATVGSTATNKPPHKPSGPGSFVRPPANQARVLTGSASVFIDKKPAARAGDRALTCNDPIDLPVGQVVVASGTVYIGG